MKHLFTSIIFLLCLCVTKANNIQISNISTLSANNTIKFDISWENSWRSSILNNWDAAYVFFKYKNVTGQWVSMPLTSVGNVIPSSYQANMYPYGALLYRATVGSGTSNILNVELGIPASQALGIFDIRGFAIEMVEIPTTNEFFAGDGASNNSYPISSIINTSTVTITDPLSTPQSVSLSYLNNGHWNFICMKYELSQGGYRDFLNTLTYNQQVNHIVPLPNAAANTAALYNLNRNSIKIKTPGVAPNTPAVFGCDANSNAVYDEANDGEWVACNYLNWQDHAAYLAWAGLNPMTEMQYEKVARGIQLPVAGEYAWGNTNVFTGSPYYMTSNINQASETMSNASVSPTGNAQYFNSYDNVGPTRNGVFATATSNRISSGGSFYGVMELSGNLWERVITTANSSGISYFNSSKIMDRELNSSGYAVTTSASATFSGIWPGSQFIPGLSQVQINAAVNATGLIYRGGGWSSNTSQLSISDRSGLLVTNPNSDRALMAEVGVRGILRE
jgi:hypothetical protein